MLTGRIVDSYTNILTVKLFARARDEDAYVRDAHRRAHRPLPRLAAAQHAVRLLPVVAQRRAGDRHRRARDVLWSRGQHRVGTVAMAMPLTWQIVSASGWVAYQITDIFENIGVVQEGMMTIARPIGLHDAPDAAELDVRKGEIAFDDVQLRLRPRDRRRCGRQCRVRRDRRLR